MLSLGPGSACDVCLEPFGVELKAPCSIPCGHVFCVNCLHQVARPNCPLCRNPFDTRYTIKLHVDLDAIKPVSPDDIPVPSDSDEGARQLQSRITKVASDGATEIQTTQLTEECKKFLLTVPKEMYSDLRTSYKMLHYMCHVKRLYVDQGRTVNQLTRNVTALTQEVDRLKAAIEVLKIEKRHLEQAWQTVSAERDNISLEYERLHERLDNTEAEIRLVTEQNETAQNQLVLLNEELQRLRSEGEFSSPEGDSPVDIRDFPPELPSPISFGPDWSYSSPNVAESDSDSLHPSTHFLTPWAVFTEPKALPDADLPEDPEPSPSDGTKPNRAYCGAAGCPHSCDCMPFLLFSPGSRDAAAASYGRSSTSDGSSTSDISSPPGAPSALSLSLNQNRARSRSRSHSRPRSRSLSRAPSPSNLITSNLPSASPLISMSSSMSIPNSHHELRGQLQALLQDPPMSSSLPNMRPSHFPSSPLSQEFRHGAGSSVHATPSKDRSMPITPSGKPRDSYLHPPMPSHSRNPSPFHTSTPLSDPANSQRPPLYRTTSSSSQVVDESQGSDKERRRAERAAARPPPIIVTEARPTPMLRPQSHSLSIPSSSSSSSQSSSSGHPLLRPQVQHTSSLRHPSPTPPLSSDAMPRAQAHVAPLPSPSVPHSSNMHQSPLHSMQRAQAHAAPAAVPPANSAPQPHTKSSSSSSSQPRPPATYTNAAAAPSALANQTTRATYGASSSRYEPDGTHPPSANASAPAREHVRRSDATDARGGYGEATRGTSKRMHAPAMTINPSVLYT